MLKSCVFALLSGCVVSLSLAASETSKPLKVTGMLLGSGIQEPFKSGLYSDIFYYLSNSTGRNIHFEVLPLMRSLKWFGDASFDCIWGGDTRMLKRYDVDTSGLVSSDNVFWSSQFIFSKEGEEPFSNLEQLKGRSVAVNTGSALIPKLQELGATVATVHDGTIKIKLLKSGRVDAAIGWVPDNLISFDREGFFPVFDPAAPLARETVRLVCHDTQVNREYITEFNSGLSKMKQSGDLERILEAYRVPAEGTLDETN